MPADEAQELWAAVKARAGRCDVSDADGLDSMRVYAAVEEVVEKQGLHAVTIGCYPHLMGRVCLAASLLADEGVPLACEGDVHGAVGQYMLHLLTGQPTHNTDWLDPVDEHSVVFTHCGSGSFSLAEKPREIRLGSVRLMGQGVCALFTSKPGPVTLVNINAGPDGYQCALLEGQAVPTEMVFPGNPLRVRFRQPVKELIPWIHEAGLGHHWMAGYGVVGEEIRAMSRIVGGSLKLVEP
jgi:L-fucose isomerase-like protein